MMKAWYEKSIHALQLNGKGERTQVAYIRAVRMGRIAERYGFRFYDALIVAAALLAGCYVLYSQDLQPGPKIDSQLTVVDPFR